jgi:hypothetical protein
MRIVPCEQYTPEWWAVRRGVPTASAFHRILTPKGKLSAGAREYIALLIAETYDSYYSIGEEYQSAAMGDGGVVEPRSRALYEYTSGLEIREVGFIFADGDRYGSSPDALVAEDGVWESKSPLPKTQISYLLDGGLPDKYRPQCHGHLIVTGRDWCDFQSFIPQFPALLVRVTPDDYTKCMKQAVEDFCDLYSEQLTKVRARMEQYIDSEIDRRQDAIPKEMQSFVAYPEAS